MDVFVVIVLLGLGGAALFMVAVAFGSRNKPIGDVIDKKKNERWAAQAMIEAGDVPEMVASANEYRRKRGLPELTVEDFEARAREDQREVLAQARQYRAERTGRRGRRRAVFS